MTKGSIEQGPLESIRLARDYMRPNTHRRLMWYSNKEVHDWYLKLYKEKKIPAAMLPPDITGLPARVTTLEKLPARMTTLEGDMTKKVNKTVLDTALDEIKKGIKSFTDGVAKSLKDLGGRITTERNKINTLMRDHNALKTKVRGHEGRISYSESTAGTNLADLKRIKRWNEPTFIKVANEWFTAKGSRVNDWIDTRLKNRSKSWWKGTQIDELIKEVAPKGGVPTLPRWLSDSSRPWKDSTFLKGADARIKAVTPALALPTWVSKVRNWTDSSFLTGADTRIRKIAPVGDRKFTTALKSTYDGATTKATNAKANLKTLVNGIRVSIRNAGNVLERSYGTREYTLPKTKISIHREEATYNKHTTHGILGITNQMKTELDWINKRTWSRETKAMHKAFVVARTFRTLGPALRSMSYDIGDAGRSLKVAAGNLDILSKRL